LQNATIGKRSLISALCWDGKNVSPSILFDVHGGITYSGGTWKYPTRQIDPIWWFGFDCAHYGDGKDWEAIKKYFLPKEWRYLYEIEYAYFDHYSVKTKKYVEEECKFLADQLVYVGEVLKSYKHFMQALKEMNAC